MPLVGFSTGAIAKGDFHRALDLMIGTSAEIVEVSSLRHVELPEVLKAINSLDFSKYRHVSVHAPTDHPDESRLVSDLDSIQDKGISVVMHPDRISDYSLWASLGSRLCIENMDNRKSTGKTTIELAEIFEKLPEASMCFDIAHARQVDPKMQEAISILATFNSHISQIHISEVDQSGVHKRLSPDSKRDYAPLMRVVKNKNIIIESPVVSETDIENELESVRSLFQTES